MNYNVEPLIWFPRPLAAYRQFASLGGATDFPNRASSTPAIGRFFDRQQHAKPHEATEGPLERALEAK